MMNERIFRQQSSFTQQQNAHVCELCHEFCFIRGYYNYFEKKKVLLGYRIEDMMDYLIGL